MEQCIPVNRQQKLATAGMRDRSAALIKKQKIKKMDWTMIISATIGYLTPYLTKTGEEVSKKIGEDLWKKIKGKFTNEKEQEVIKQIENAPTSLQNQEDVKTSFENLLQNKLNEDETLLNELQKVLERGKKMDLRQINQHGEKSVYLENNQGGTINIS